MYCIAFIDPSCISELGRDWEGYHTATRAAAAGGITTLMGMVLRIPSNLPLASRAYLTAFLCFLLRIALTLLFLGMPLNSLPPTTTVDALQQEIDASRKVKLMSDVGLWGGAVPTNTSCDNMGCTNCNNTFRIPLL